SPFSTRQARTTFLAPVSPATIFTGGPEAIRMRDITDGTSNTILIVDADADLAQPWTKPDDLKIDPRQPEAGLFGSSRTGCNVAFADGSVRFLTRRINRTMLYALFTRNGGEIINPQEF